MIPLPADLLDDGSPDPPARAGPFGFVVRLLRGPALAPAPEVPRERRARRAVEGLLSAAVVLSTALAVLHGPTTDAGASGRDPPSSPGESPWRSIPIDLARDPPWLLRLLPGVGPTRAAALVRDRETNGPLPSVAALVRVPGFGERTAAALAAAGAIAAPREPP